MQKGGTEIGVGVRKARRELPAFLCIQGFSLLLNLQSQITGHCIILLPPPLRFSGRDLMEWRVSRQYFMKWCSCKVSLYLRCYLQTCTEAHGGFFPFKFFFFFLQVQLDQPRTYPQGKLQWQHIAFHTLFFISEHICFEHSQISSLIKTLSVERESNQ